MGEHEQLDLGALEELLRRAERRASRRYEPAAFFVAVGDGHERNPFRVREGGNVPTLGQPSAPYEADADGLRHAFSIVVASSDPVATDSASVSLAIHSECARTSPSASGIVRAMRSVNSRPASFRIELTRWISS